MADISNSKIKDTYDGLLHTSDGLSLTLGDGGSTSDLQVQFKNLTLIGGNVNCSLQVNSSTTNSVSLGRAAFVSAGVSSVNIGILNNQTGGTLLSTGAIIGTPTASNCGNASIAIGINNKSSETSCSAFGYGNQATTNSSSAFGYNNLANGTSSSAFGYFNNSSEIYSSAFGSFNNANAADSSAFGSSNSADAEYSSAFGYSNNASAEYSSAFGYSNDAFGNSSSAFGYNNDANETSSSAFGYSNITDGINSSAFGYGNSAAGNNSSAFGYNTLTSISGTCEIGYSDTLNSRNSAVRMHPDKQVAFTYKTSVSAPTDGGSAVGAETTGKLPRNMFTIQRSGNALYLYCNDSTGSIKSLHLGNLT